MDPEAVVTQTSTIQTALSIILLYINLTGYLFPQDAVIESGFIYDFIVVGSGSAGSVIASRLTENENFNVLLIEAGGDPPLQCMMPSLMQYTPDSLIDWNYTSQKDDFTMQCHKKGVINLTRGKVLGGSSCSGYMIYSRGSPHDYERWAEISDDNTWKWENVLPYFIKSEDLEDEAILESPDGKYHGTQGYVKVARELNNKLNYFIESLKGLGYPIIEDINGNQTQGYTQPMFTLAGGVRQSAAYCFLSPVKDRPNLHILRDSLVSKIIFNENKRATGVQVITKDNQNLIINVAKEIIVSAGAINSPQLLMLSGIGPKEHLKSLNIPVVADLPVGKNYQDHVPVPIYIKMEESNVTTPASDANIFITETLTGYVALNKSQPYPDYQMQIYKIPHDFDLITIFFSVNYNFKDDISQKIVDGCKGRNAAMSLLTNLHPKSKGQILLQSSDPKDNPLIYTGYFSENVDLENTIEYIQDYLRILDTEYFKKVNATFVDLTNNRCGDFERSRAEYWRCYIRCMMNTLYDFIGTCAIGSVVDSKLRVIGIEGLRVADASVIPEGTSGNVNAPSMMLGEKVSDMIKNKYKTSCNL